MGDEFHRPHYHFLFYNLSDQQVSFLSDCWQRDYGYCEVDKIPVLNKDGSPARVKVSKYVAKYLRKPKKDYLPLLKGLCESPRRVSSRRFGLDVLPDSLKSFYTCEDLSSFPDDVRFSSVLERKKSLIIDGVKFPLPRRISEQYFRSEIKPLVNEYVSKKTGEITKQFIRQTCRTTLSLKVGNFARDRYLQDIIDKFRRYSETHSDSEVDRFAKEFIDNESRSLEDRAQSARKFYLQCLKKQKYG